MDEENNRELFLLAFFPSFGLQYPPLNVLLTRAFEPELLSFAQVLSFQCSFSEPRDLLRLAFELDNRLALLDLKLKSLQSMQNENVVGGGQ